MKLKFIQIMASRSAKITPKQRLTAALRRANRGHHPERDRAIVLLSIKIGLRAGEIAKLIWLTLREPQEHLTGKMEFDGTAAQERRRAHDPATAPGRGVANP